MAPMNGYRRLHLQALLPSLWALSVLASSATADEAILPDGRRVEGRLAMDASGRLEFFPANSQGRLDLANLHEARLATTIPFSWRHGNLYVVHLRNEQRLVGELLGLDDKELRVRTPLLSLLKVPRSALAAITQPAGLMTVLYEDFEADFKAWKLKGLSGPSGRKPCLGKQSLPLDQPGQEAILELAKPLAAGRVDVHFHVPGNAAGARWTCAAQFGTGNGSRTLTVVLAGEGRNYALEANLPGAQARVVPRSPGWHRLSIRFHPSYALVGIDDAVLWMNEKVADLGLLHSIRFACAGSKDQKELRGELFIDDLVISRMVQGLPRPTTDAKQDEVWLESGDQLFGQVTRADRQAVTLKQWGAKQTIPWAEARGIFFPQSDGTAQTAEGGHVRLWLETGCGAETDQIDGLLQKLDDKQLVLRHRVLGDVTLDRSRVRKVRLVSPVMMP
jgi:hypothetical protein